MDSILKDWPNLARYREANANSRRPKTNPVSSSWRLITDAWPQPRFGEFFPGKPYIGRGISGQTLRKCSCAFAGRHRPRAQSRRHPRRYKRHRGNTGPMSLEEIEPISRSCPNSPARTASKVVLASVLPVYDGGHNGEGKEIVMTECRPPEKIHALNDWIKKYSAENKLVYLDYFSAMVDEKGFLKRELSEDGLHPNKAGYAVMAPLAEKAIQSALKCSWPIFSLFGARWPEAACEHRRPPPDLNRSNQFVKSKIQFVFLSRLRYSLKDVFTLQSSARVVVTVCPSAVALRFVVKGSAPIL